MEFTVPSGSDVIISIADWEDCIDLQDMILAELSQTGINLDNRDDIDMGKILASGMKLAGSKPIRQALFKCLLRCTYNKEKITAKTFEDEKARGDYYEIALACIKVNLSPFFNSLLSKSKEVGIILKEKHLP